MTIPINSMVLGKLGVNGDRQTFGIGADGDPSPSLSTAHHHAVCYSINPQGGGGNAIGFLQKQSAAARSIGEGPTSPTLSQDAQHIAVCYDGYNQKGYEEVCMTLRSANGGGERNDACPKVAIGFKAGQSKDGGLGDEREVSPTLSHQPSALEPTVAQSTFVRIGSMTRRDRPTPPSEEVAHALTKTDGDAGDNAASVVQSLASMRYIVRRLMPTECMRLMGLPDDYCIPTGLRRFFDANGEPSPELVSEFVDRFDTFNAIMAEYEHKKPPKGKSYNQVAAWLKKISDPATCPDSPMYKGCGNGWATNQPRWILTRLLALGEGIDPFTGEELEAREGAK